METDFKSRVILVLDEERDVQLFVEKQADAIGYQTIVVQSGIDALEKLDQLKGHIALLILDILMPETLSVEIVKTVRRQYPHIPLIVLTSETDKEAECLEIGVEYFVPKPYSQEELSDHIQTLLGHLDEERIPWEIPAGYAPSAKILVVDDNQDMCESLADMLSEDILDSNYIVRYALSGEDALRVSQEFEPDIAIIDIKMKHMWGDQLIEKFKQGEAPCPKDFIVYTGHDMPEQKAKAKRNGHLFFTKPTGIEEFSEVLKRICIRHRLFERTY